MFVCPCVQVYTVPTFFAIISSIWSHHLNMTILRGGKPWPRILFPYEFRLKQKKHSTCSVEINKIKIKENTFGLCLETVKFINNIEWNNKKIKPRKDQTFLFFAQIYFCSTNFRSFTLRSREYDFENKCFGNENMLVLAGFVAWVFCTIQHT